jgi:hypothetical protein
MGSLDEKGRTDILKKQNVDHYVGVTNPDFKSLNEAVRMAGLL